MSEQVQIGEGTFGPVFVLEPPHTVESIRRDAARDDPPWLCRRGLHRRRTVGRPLPLPENPSDADFTAMVLTIVSDVRALTRCTRCGVIAVRYGG